jgi:hypothetical protein
MAPHQVEELAIARGLAAKVEQEWLGDAQRDGHTIRRARRAPRTPDEPMGTGERSPFAKSVPYILSVHKITGKGWLYVGYIALLLFQADNKAKRLDVNEIRASLLARLAEAAAAFVCPGLSSVNEKLLGAAGAIVHALAMSGFYDDTPKTPRYAI